MTGFGIDRRARAASDAGLTILLAVLGGICAHAGFSLLERARDTGWQDSLLFEAALGGLASIAGTGLLLWWLVAITAAAVSTPLSRRGHVRAASVASRISPAFMRRLVAGALGLQLATTAVLGTGWVAAATEQPVDPQFQLSAPVVPPRPAPVPPLVNPRWRPAAPPMAPGPLAPVPGRSGLLQDGGSGAGADQVVVRVGDSLWSIAASRLGPFATDVEVAQEWPRWYRANVGIIGPDANLLQPGQILRVP